MGKRQEPGDVTSCRKPFGVGTQFLIDLDVATLFHNNVESVEAESARVGYSSGGDEQRVNGRSVFTDLNFDAS